MKGQQLPYYQPEGIVVTRAAHQQRTRVESMHLNRSAVKNMAPGDAYRELLQNMCDAIVEANGHRFNGITISRYETPSNGGRVTVFHTATHILGEIVETRTRVSFVNMGPHIESLSQIIQTGASKKDTMPNQAGQHGEGLKRAALKLLTQGFQVDVWFPLCIANDDMVPEGGGGGDGGDESRTEMRHLVFSLHPTQRCLTYTLTTFRPTERHKGAGDFHRFQVDVTSGDKVPAFNLYHYMLHESLIRDPVAPGEAGRVLLDRHNGVYVWHFYVTSFPNLFYSYDLFLPRLARDRNDVPHQTLCEYVAKIWSAAIVDASDNGGGAGRFYNDILMRESLAPNTVEALALPLFSADAARRLYAEFQKKSGGTSLRPVRAADWHQISDQFDKAFFVIVPPQAMVLFDLVLPPLDVHLAHLVTTFTTTNDGAFVEFEQQALAPRRVCTIYRPLCPVKYASRADAGIIMVNTYSDRLTDATGRIGPDQWEGFWNAMLFDYLPKLFAPFNGMRIAAKLFPTAAAAAGRGSPVTFHIIDSSDDDSAGDVAPTATIPTNKRGALPEGFEFYSGPPLIIKKQK